jgi:predicted Abi (CAAX) family protease
MIRARLADLAAALRQVPGPAGWARAALELGWALPLMLLLAHLGGLIRLQSPPDAITALTLPTFAAMTLSALLFVLWHPLQAATIGPPWAGAFLDPWFLAATATLGIALARIYAATWSLWPCVLAHWLVVLGWKLFLGGPF